MAKVHIRDYNPKQIILFPQRLDKDIAENDPVRIVDTIVDQLSWTLPSLQLLST